VLVEEAVMARAIWDLTALRMWAVIVQLVVMVVVAMAL
jgi:hypothetical protein